MKRLIYSLALVSAVAVVFLAVMFLSQRSVSGKSSRSGKILYYIDPMHPAYKSAKPGIAPDCGMRLEPVYAPENLGPRNVADSPAVTIDPDMQRSIGMEVMVAEKRAATHTLRVLGRVAADETRVYKLIAGMDGVVREISGVTTGSQVTKGQLLATFSAPELRAPIQGYIVSLDVIDRQKEGGAQAPAQLQAANESMRQALDRLLNLGLSTVQLEEVMRTRELPTDLKVYAPAAGFVVARNVSNGQRFDKGTEWFRIADLRHIWITADVFERESAYLRPGQPVKVERPGGGAEAAAKVSEILPQFDGGSRTLKVRLEVENPDYAFRPDMFVDVRVPVALPPSIALPADAVLDSGLHKSVFVDLGEGRFESRQVETGWRFDDQVQIRSGLHEGEHVVTSANFLLDSETRMRRGASDVPQRAGGVQ